MHALESDDLVTLVNEWGTRPREEAGEGDEAFPDPRTAGLAASEDTDVLVRTADRLHPVFAAPTPRDRVRQLDRLIAETGVTVHLRSDDAGHAHEEWVPARSADALLVAALRTLADVVVLRGAQTIGVCGGQECVDAWIDSPRGRPRRYCSTQCAGRARVAAHRRRSREDAR
ncbi:MULTISPECIES: CGNR zinc finger domain-containing protein [Mumia]|uniref:CGNR zinc finger domain-containing protein n=1 Tax=Mumia TaxID=1546255 RepID=UPI00141DC25C|nr:CGNR zinc finger domain-containing protein [Mumia sp. ZJ430]